MPTPIGSPCPSEPVATSTQGMSGVGWPSSMLVCSAVVEDVLVGDDARCAVDGVQERRGVALREDEPVVRGALRVGEVEAQVAVHEDGHQIRRGHGRRRVPRLRRRAHPHGVDPELLTQLAAAIGVCHARHSRFVDSPSAQEVTLGRGAQQIARALRERSERVGGLALARDARDGPSRSADGGGRRRRRDLEPDDLREGALDGRLVRRAAARRSSSAPTTRRRCSSRSPWRTSSAPAICSCRCGSAPTASTASSRSRSIRISPTSGRTRSSRRSSCTSSSIGRTCT